MPTSVYSMLYFIRLVLLMLRENTTEWRLLYLHPAVIMPFKISTIMENIAIPFYIKFNHIF